MDENNNNTSNSNTSLLPDPNKQFLKQLRTLSPSQIDEIARQMLKDPALADVQWELFENELTDHDVDKIIAKEQGQLSTIYVVRFTGERLRE